MRCVLLYYTPNLFPVYCREGKWPNSKQHSRWGEEEWKYSIETWNDLLFIYHFFGCIGHFLPSIFIEGESERWNRFPMTMMWCEKWHWPHKLLIFAAVIYSLNYLFFLCTIRFVCRRYNIDLPPEVGMQSLIERRIGMLHRTCLPRTDNPVEAE